MKATIEQLLGCWKSDTTDPNTLASAGEAIQEFFPGGHLMYAARSGSDITVMELTYELKDGMMTTDQPSKPHRHTTHVELDPAGRLLIGEGRERTIFVRAPGAT